MRDIYTLMRFASYAGLWTLEGVETNRDEMLAWAERAAANSPVKYRVIKWMNGTQEVLIWESK